MIRESAEGSSLCLAPPPLGCSAVPRAAMGCHHEHWRWPSIQQPVRLSGLPGRAWQRCKIRQLEALKAAQHPAVWLESCHCRLEDSDVLQMKHLHWAGVCSAAVESRVVTGAHAGWDMGPGPCACSLCPGELIWLFGCSYRSHLSGGGHCPCAALCTRPET